MEEEMTTESIHGPCEGHAGVIDRDSYRDVHQRVMKAKGEQVLEVSAPRAAYVNWGRWVVDCECNGAGLSDRKIKQACCFDCGRVYDVTFPKRAAQIEKVLLERPDPASRNWAGETVQALLDDNAKHLGKEA
jgi:hypothetical protein